MLSLSTVSTLHKRTALVCTAWVYNLTMGLVSLGQPGHTLLMTSTYSNAGVFSFIQISWWRFCYGAQGFNCTTMTSCPCSIYLHLRLVQCFSACLPPAQPHQCMKTAAAPGSRSTRRCMLQ